MGRMADEGPSRPFWFPAKRYGWGWGLPATWQGWLVLVAYLLVAGVLPFVCSPVAHPLLFTGAMLGLTLVLVWVCWLTGEPPRWRWGEDGDEREG